MVLVLPQNRSTVADIHSSRSFFHSYHDHRDLPSFPTRRSSDLLRHSLGSAQRVEATLLYSIQRQQLEDQVTSVTGLPYERSEEHTSELQSPYDLVCRLLLEKKKTKSEISEPALRCSYTSMIS